jgi:hypothetical protein
MSLKNRRTARAPRAPGRGKRGAKSACRIRSRAPLFRVRGLRAAPVRIGNLDAGLADRLLDLDPVAFGKALHLRLGAHHGKAHWVKIETEILPNGDEIACSTLWKAPNPFDGVTEHDLKVVQKVVQTGAFRTDSRSPHWLGWWMAENLPHLNIKARHTTKPHNKSEVARLNSFLKTWLKNNALETAKGPERLLSAQRINVEKFGPPSKQRQRLIVATALIPQPPQYLSCGGDASLENDASTNPWRTKPGKDRLAKRAILLTSPLDTVLYLAPQRGAQHTIAG